MKSSRSQKGSINPITIVFIILVILGGLGFIYFSKNVPSSSQLNNSTNTQDNPLEVNANDFYVFYYPKQFIKNEIPESNTLSTYVYSYSPAKEANLKDGVGIKMFIMPYTKHLPTSSLDTCNNLIKSILNNSDVIKTTKVDIADGQTAYGCDTWLSNQTADKTDTLINHMKFQWFKSKTDNSLLVTQGSYFESTPVEVKTNIDSAVEKFYLK